MGIICQKHDAVYTDSFRMQSFETTKRFLYLILEKSTINTQTLYFDAVKNV